MFIRYGLTADMNSTEANEANETEHRCAAEPGEGFSLYICCAPWTRELDLLIDQDDFEPLRVDSVFLARRRRRHRG